MIFNSATYLIFLAAFVLLYWWLPDRPRRWLILLGSLTFYGFWRAEFILVMMFSISVDYFAALAIEAESRPSRRRWYLAASLATNLGLLCFFKYTGFLVGNINGLARLLGWSEIPFTLQIVLPLGISFYTFQSISYTVDVYRRFIPAERSYLCFVNFVLFFPQLVAGPILRGAEVIEQLKVRGRFDPSDLPAGMKAILSGLFLKVVMADNVGALVDEAFAAPISTLGAVDVWAMAVLFGFQIYFDFAGYSQIAIGSARLMGIHFPRNFDFPYLADSPREFWRRWHISLSSWIRDYLYLPLCGARVHDESVGGLAEATEGSAAEISPVRRAMALVATWAVMGLWHGAAWAFVLWGLWHAALILGYRGVSNRLSMPAPLARPLGWVVTFPLVMLGWIPFRAAGMTDALAMIATALQPAAFAVPLSFPRHFYMVAVLLPLLAWAAATIRRMLACRPGGWSTLTAEFVGVAATAALVFVFLRPIRQFIYFQF